MKIENFNSQLNIFFEKIDQMIQSKTPNLIEFAYKGWGSPKVGKAEVSREAYLKFGGYSKEKVKEIIEKRFKTRHGTAEFVKVLKIEPKVVPNFGREKDCVITGRIIYEVKERLEDKPPWRRGKMIFYLFSKDNMWAGVEIGDPYGYFDLAFDSIDERVLMRKDWETIKDDLSTTDEALKNLCSKIEGYSRSKILNLVREKLEEEYNHNPDIVIELVGIEPGPVGVRDDIFVQITFCWAVSTSEEFGIDAPLIDVNMYSKNEIELKFRR